jgi:hypothetical protein
MARDHDEDNPMLTVLTAMYGTTHGVAWFRHPRYAVLMLLVRRQIFKIYENGETTLILGDTEQ